jgi:hypothetical protein
MAVRVGQNGLPEEVIEMMVAYIAGVVALVTLGGIIGGLVGAAFRIHKDERAFRQDLDERRRALRSVARATEHHAGLPR